MSSNINILNQPIVIVATDDNNTELNAANIIEDYGFETVDNIDCGKTCIEDNNKIIISVNEEKDIHNQVKYSCSCCIR